VAALVAYADALDALEGIDRVESPFSNLVNPLTQQAMTPEEIEAAWANPAARPLLQPLLEFYVRGSTVRLDAISPYPAAQPTATTQILVIRAVDGGPGITTAVGGTAAGSYDFLHSMEEQLPLMLITVIGAMRIFQQGHLEGLLDFESPGYTVAGNPIIMFGLSMDYEVLLLSRIQEAYRRTGDNTLSVGEGLARTAGVITGAALIMVIVFGAFALAETISIKSIVVGMAIAVAIDATIIRVLLVPATMRLLGRWTGGHPGRWAGSRTGSASTTSRRRTSTPMRSPRRPTWRRGPGQPAAWVHHRCDSSTARGDPPPSVADPHVGWHRRAEV